MRLKIFLLGTALGLSFATAASAAVERHGWYVGLEGAWVHVNDTDLTNWGYQELQFENRWGALGTVGYAFNGNWRLEFEPGYRTNDLHSIDFGSGPTFPNDGKLTEWSGMFNAVYDQPITQKWTIDFGVGIGVDDVRFDDNLGNEDRDAVLAAQGILGLSYRVAPHWDLMLNYRYLWADQPSFTDGSGNTDQMEIGKHTVSLGFRYGFEDVAAPLPPAPPPPPPPPAAPPAVKQFIIFFGFNKCDITPEADRVLGDAANTAKSTGAAAIKIVGHTDTSGSNAYNQRLSECRSNAAKTNMVAKGVPAASISTSGKGEAELMVQTGDGVKEPQNRRATVDLE